MANTGMVMGRWTSHPAEDQTVRNALQTFHQELIKAFADEAAKHGINPRALIITSPHDAGLWLTASSVVIVVSKGSATDATSTHYCGDYTNSPEVVPEGLVHEARGTLNWSDAIPFVFDRALFTDSNARAARFKAVAEQEIARMKARLDDINKLGITEAATYITNARARFESQTPAGYSDCKASCRNAIASLLTKLTGETDPRAAIRSLSKEGVFGDREKDVFEAIEGLAGSLVGLASKKGSHPPLADAFDAQLTLRLTEALFDFIVGYVVSKRLA